MYINHRHYPEELRKLKHRAKITEDRPLVVVLSQQYPLLNFTLTSVLQYHGYAFLIKTASDEQCMDYTLPILCCEDVVLQREALVDLLADIALGNYELDEYLIRKENMKNLYRTWSSLIKDEREQTSVYSRIRQIIRNDQNNKAFEEFTCLSIFVVNKAYERIHNNYEGKAFNIQAVFAVDVTETIIKSMERSTLDFILRGYFSKQIDFSEEYGALIRERFLGGRSQEREILMDGEQAEVVEYPQLNVNAKWFAGFFVAMSFIFVKWTN